MYLCSCFQVLLAFMLYFVAEPVMSFQGARLPVCMSPSPCARSSLIASTCEPLLNSPCLAQSCASFSSFCQPPQSLENQLIRNLERPSPVSIFGSSLIKVPIGWLIVEILLLNHSKRSNKTCWATLRPPPALWVWIRTPVVSHSRVSVAFVNMLSLCHSATLFTFAFNYLCFNTQPDVTWRIPLAISSSVCMWKY